MTDLLSQKNTEGVNSTQKNTSDLPVMYTASTPPGKHSSLLWSSSSQTNIFINTFPAFLTSPVTKKSQDQSIFLSSEITDHI